MVELPPEKLARQQIDTQLASAGWVVQDYRAVDFSAGSGIALREVPLKTGPARATISCSSIASRSVSSRRRRQV
jgi:type I restriction enzyme, R subunit